MVVSGYGVGIDKGKFGGGLPAKFDVQSVGQVRRRGSTQKCTMIYILLQNSNPETNSSRWSIYLNANPRREENPTPNSMLCLTRPKSPTAGPTPDSMNPKAKFKIYVRRRTPRIKITSDSTRETSPRHHHIPIFDPRLTDWRYH